MTYCDQTRVGARVQQELSTIGKKDIGPKRPLAHLFVHPHLLRELLGGERGGRVAAVLFVCSCSILLTRSAQRGGSNLQRGREEEWRRGSKGWPDMMCWLDSVYMHEGCKVQGMAAARV
jgi:hypothetical protein